MSLPIGQILDAHDAFLLKDKHAQNKNLLNKVNILLSETTWKFPNNRGSAVEHNFILWMFYEDSMTYTICQPDVNPLPFEAKFPIRIHRKQS